MLEYGLEDADRSVTGKALQDCNKKTCIKTERTAYSAERTEYSAERTAYSAEGKFTQELTLTKTQDYFRLSTTITMADK